MIQQGRRVFLSWGAAPEAMASLQRAPQPGTPELRLEPAVGDSFETATYVATPVDGTRANPMNLRDLRRRSVAVTLTTAADGPL